MLFFSITGVGPSTSLQPCPYCPGYKLDELGKKTNQRAKKWEVPAARRSPGRNRKMFKRMCDTIKKAKTKKEKKDAPKNHESVIGECIRLKDSNVNVSILLLFPPDPLHIVLLGK